MADSIDLNDLNKLRESIEEKDRQLKGNPTADLPSTQVNKEGHEESNTTVVFSPTIKEPDLSKSALSQTQRSSEAVGEMVTDIFKQGVVHAVANDQTVQEKILDTAKKAVEDKVEAISYQTTKEAQVSAYDANSDACENYGIMKDVPKWKINMMKVGSAFWFIIYFIFASLTVAPITIFLKGLTGVIKQVWLAAVVAVLFYLFIAVGVPFLVSYLNIK